MTSTLCSVADILRLIFSRTIANKNYSTYREIRLTCKHFKAVLDTLDVTHLIKELIHRYSMKVRSFLHAPKRIQRIFLLICPRAYLQQLQRLMGCRNFSLHADPTNKLFRYCIRRRNTPGEDVERMDNQKLWGCRVVYYSDPSYGQLLEILQLYLGFDEEIRIAYKNVVVSLLAYSQERSTFDRPEHLICRELFAAIGSLLPFTEEELARKIDVIRYAFIRQPTLDTYHDDNVEDEIQVTEEDYYALYLDERRKLFRFYDSREDETNMDPQYWSIATLNIWRERVCYD